MPELLKKVISKSVVLRQLFILHNSKFTEKLQEYYTTRKSHMLFTQIHQFLIVYSICFIVFFFVFFFLPSIYPSLYHCVCVCVFFSLNHLRVSWRHLVIGPLLLNTCVYSLRINRSKLSKPETLTSVQCFYLTHCLNSNFTNCFNIILQLATPSPCPNLRSDPGSHITCNHHVSSVSFNLQYFLSLSLSLLKLTFLKSLDQLFYRMFLIVRMPDVFSL